MLHQAWHANGIRQSKNGNSYRGSSWRWPFNRNLSVGLKLVYRRWHIRWTSRKLYAFKPTSGLRQGVPISPYVFILVAYLLSRQVTNAMEARVMEGVMITRSCLTLHHILVADDSVSFKWAISENVQTLKILDIYYRSPEQGINMPNQVLYSTRTHRSKREPRSRKQSRFKRQTNGEVSRLSDYLGSI